MVCHPSFLPLGATAQGELWPPEQCASILYSSSIWYDIIVNIFYMNFRCFYLGEQEHKNTFRFPTLYCQVVMQANV
jgi:hypothetical protein